MQVMLGGGTGYTHVTVLWCKILIIGSFLDKVQKIKIPIHPKNYFILWHHHKGPFKREVLSAVFGFGC